MKEVSENQKKQLQRAQKAGYFELPRYLYQLIREKPEEEPFDPGWAELWDQLAPEIKSRSVAPTDVIQEIEKNLASIERIDDEIKALKINPDTKLTIFLGAGASAPEPSSIPIVSELLPELWDRARKIGREDIDKLSKWCKSNGIVNIEDLLTAAYIANFSAKNAGITGLLDYFLFQGRRMTPQEERWSPVERKVLQVDAASIALFQDTLQTLFGLLMNTMLPAKPNAAHEAITKLLAIHPTATSIVTTNYDGCIDEALINAGVKVNAHLDEIPPDEGQAVNLIKMHGSINWTYCDSCQRVKRFDLSELKKAYEEDRLSYAVIGICRTCNGLRRPLLVPPLALKFVIFPNLIGVWNTARKIIREADLLLVVGYSFSDTDTYINKIISQSLSENSTQKMIVCDSNPKLVPLLRERFSSHIDDFDKRRILRASGSCEQKLPLIVDWIIKNSCPSDGKKETVSKRLEFVKAAEKSQPNEAD